MAIKKIEIQDSNGDVYHPHTTTDVVFNNQNKKLSDLLNEKVDKNSAGGIDLSAGDGKGLKVGGSRIFEHSDSGLYFRTKNNKGFDFTDSSIRPSNTDCTIGTNAIPFDNIHLAFPHLGGNGYTKLPNGLILQWGESSRNLDASGTGHTMDIPFPIAFPNTFITAHATLCNNGHDSGKYISHGIYTDNNWHSTVKMTVYAHTVALGAPTTFRVFWWAIGY